MEHILQEAEACDLGRDLSGDKSTCGMALRLPLQLQGARGKAQGSGRLARGGKYSEDSGCPYPFQEGLDQGPGFPLFAPRGPSTCSVGHLHTLLNLAVLLLAQACDPSRQQASARPDELTEQQNILGATENCSQPASGCLVRGTGPRGPQRPKGLVSPSGTNRTPHPPRRAFARWPPLPYQILNPKLVKIFQPQGLPASPWESLRDRRTETLHEVFIVPARAAPRLVMKGL